MIYLHVYAQHDSFVSIIYLFHSDVSFKCMCDMTYSHIYHLFVTFWCVVQMYVRHDFFNYIYARYDSFASVNYLTYCNTLQHNATHCSTLQHTATHCNTLQHTATHCTSTKVNRTGSLAIHCNTLRPNATHCNTLQHTATHWKSTYVNRTGPLATHCNTLQHTATHCNTLQHTAALTWIGPAPSSKSTAQHQTHVCVSAEGTARADYNCAPPRLRSSPN